MRVCFEKGLSCGNEQGQARVFTGFVPVWHFWHVAVSTEEQAKEGYSIRAQKQKLKDYARIKDWHIYDVYMDEGISGKNITDRPEINRLIEDVTSGNVMNVLVFKIDRLTRSTFDLIYLVDLFNEHDCAFNSLTESIDTQTASGRMFIKIVGIFAEFERENLSERIRIGFERKVREGYTLCTSTASYGYERPDGQKIQTIIENEAQIVREIFEWYVRRGVNITEIARRLNLRGVATKYGNKWTSGGVRNILCNTNYIGDVRHHYLNKERSYSGKGHHEPIISQEMFDKAKHRLNKNPRISPRKQPMEENYFSGFLRCAQCGHKLQPHNMYNNLADGTRKFYGNYECSNNIVGACDASSMSAKNLEKAFSEYIARITNFEDDTSIYIYQEQQKKKEAQGLLTTYKDKIRRLEAKARESLDCYVNNVFTVEEYHRVKKHLDGDRQAILADMKSLLVEAEEIAGNQPEITRNLKENWDGLSNLDKRLFLMEFVETIVVQNEKIGAGHHRKQIRIFDVTFKIV